MHSTQTKPSLLTGLLALAALCSTTASAAGDPPRQPDWSLQDLHAVVDAGITTAESVPTKSTKVSNLIDFANALVKIGLESQAHDALVRASALLDASTDYANEFARERIVQFLARLGDVATAEALANVEATTAVKSTLLGKIAEGRAEAGDVAYAVATVSKIEALARPMTRTPPPDYAGGTVAGIGVALASKGVTGDALDIADRLPNGLQRQRILNHVARYLCTGNESAESLAKGREVTGQAMKSARLALGDLGLASKMINLTGANLIIASIVTDSIAECHGAGKATDYIRDIASPQSADLVLSRLADELTTKGEFRLARAVAPAPDPAVPQSVVDAAKRALKQGDTETAKATALEASRLLSTNDYSKARTQIELRSSIFYVLIGAKDYADALSIIAPIDPGNRQQFYLTTLHTLIQNRDYMTRADIFIQALESAKLSGWGGPLFNIVMDLARSGDSDAAAKLFAELQTMPDTGGPTSPYRISPSEIARFKASIGDFDGALAAVSDAGPMVMKPSLAQVLVGTAIQLSGATHQPTEAEIAAVATRVQAAMPPLIPGPRANLLEIIVSDLAAQNNLQEAQRFEAMLEVEPTDILAAKRNGALTSIADIQIKSGNFREAFATVQRVTESSARWKLLLKLVEAAPRL